MADMNPIEGRFALLPGRVMRQELRTAASPAAQRLLHNRSRIADEQHVACARGFGNGGGKAQREPLPSRPTRFSLGTFTSVKKVSQKGDEPEIRRIGFTSTPGESMSISRKLMPSCFFVLSVRTSAKHLSAHWPPEVHVF